MVPGMTIRSPYAPTTLALTALTLSAGTVLSIAQPAYAGGIPGPAGAATSAATAAPVPSSVSEQPETSDASITVPLTDEDTPADVEVDRILTDAVELHGDWDEGWTGYGRDFTWYQRRGFRWEVGYGWGRWHKHRWVPCERPTPPPPPRPCDCEEPTPGPTTPPVVESPEPEPEPEPTSPEPQSPEPTPVVTETASAPTKPAVVVPVNNPAPPAPPVTPEVAPPVNASEELPVTGASTGWLAGGAALTSLIGAGLIVATRRRVRVPSA